MTTYFVDQVLDIDVGYGTGSVTGSIDVYSTGVPWWDLTVSVGTRSFEFTPLTSGQIVGNAELGVNGDELLFDFTSRYFFFSRGAGTGYIVGWQSGCNSTSDGLLCGLTVGQLGYDIRGTDWHPITAWHADTGVIGHAVPGPVVGSGLLGLVMLVYLIHRRIKCSSWNSTDGSRVVI